MLLLAVHYAWRTLMPQQINLLNSLPKAPRFNLSNRFIYITTAGYAAFLLVLILVQAVMLGWGKISLDALKKTYLQHEIELNKNMELASLNNTHQLEQQLQEKRELLQTLASRKSSSGQCSMLSYYFQVFSQTVVPGLWLTKINIDLSQDLMSLSGATYLASLPISFIQSIEKNNCFSNRQFGPIDLFRQSQTLGVADAATTSASSLGNAFPPSTDSSVTGSADTGSQNIASSSANSAGQTNLTQKPTEPSLIEFTFKSSPESKS